MTGPHLVSPSTITRSLSCCESNVTVVLVEAALRFIDRLALRGSLRSSSRLPQYFTNAMLECATAVALDEVI
jgi:hypothetical protein